MEATTGLYLLGAVACAEKLFTFFPAALERLEVGAGVVVDQVLLQVLLHPKDQPAAVPLWTRARNLTQTKLCKRSSF